MILGVDKQSRAGSSGSSKSAEGVSPTEVNEQTYRVIDLQAASGRPLNEVIDYQI